MSVLLGKFSVSKVGPEQKSSMDIWRKYWKKETYAGRPTDVISVPLTIRTRSTVTFPMGAGVVWGAPARNVKIDLSPVSRSFAVGKTCAHSNHRQGPTNLQVGATSCSCGEKQIILVSLLLVRSPTSS